jgi:hypothetical protein
MQTDDKMVAAAISRATYNSARGDDREVAVQDLLRRIGLSR